MMDPHLSDEEAIEAANLAFFRAFEENDLASLANTWATGVVGTCVFEGSQVAQGVDQVVELHKQLGQFVTGRRLSVYNWQVFVAGESAWMLFVEQWEGQNPDGKAIKIQYYTTHIFVREDDAWRIAHRHLSVTGPRLFEDSAIRH